jgi:hypothetical protein
MGIGLKGQLGRRLLDIIITASVEPFVFCSGYIWDSVGISHYAKSMRLDERVIFKQK